MLYVVALSYLDPVYEPVAGDRDLLRRLVNVERLVGFHSNAVAGQVRLNLGNHDTAILSQRQTKEQKGKKVQYMNQQTSKYYYCCSHISDGSFRYFPLHHRDL